MYSFVVHLSSCCHSVSALPGGIQTGRIKGIYQWAVRILESPSESDALHCREPQDGNLCACSPCQESIWHLAQPLNCQSRTSMGTTFYPSVYNCHSGPQQRMDRHAHLPEVLYTF